MATINGETGIVRQLDGRAHSTMSLATDGQRIFSVYIVLNPDKLCHLSEATSATSDGSVLSQRA